MILYYAMSHFKDQLQTVLQYARNLAIWTVYCVVCAAAMSLPYETYETTGKDVVLERTHNTKELQGMKCNQFCLCRLRHS